MGEAKASPILLFTREWELSQHRSQGNDEAAVALRESWFSRMWSVSYRSVLVEGVGQTLRAMAAYIDPQPSPGE